MRNPGLRAALKAVGSQRLLGDALGITAQAVQAWQRVPAERVVEVEKVTGVPREVLRPDLYRRAEAKAAREAWAAQAAD